MEASKIILLSAVALCSLLVGIRSGADFMTPEPDIEQLRSQIAALEASCLDRRNEIKHKDENILQLEKAMNERSAHIAALTSEIELLQRKGSASEDESAHRANAHDYLLEKQIERLESELEAQIQKREALEARVSEAEKKVLELSCELGHIYASWLPSWLGAHVELASTKWNMDVKPTLDVFIQKVMEKSVKTQKSVEPYFIAATYKWIPALKQYVELLKNYTEPYVRLGAAKIIESYKACSDAIKPHIVRGKQTVGPYFQEAKKYFTPYIVQINRVAEPHVAKVHLVLEPYKNHIISTTNKLVGSASMYHKQVQEAAQEILLRHELLKRLASEKLGLFMASALFALLLFLLYRIFAAIFSKRTSRTRKARGDRASQRHTR